MALLVTAGGAAALGFLGGLPDPWTGWRPATCMPEACFCELVRPAAVRQPANALSSLAFLPVAVLVLGSVGRAGRGGLRKRPVLGRLFGLALALTGLGSAFFHASLSFAGQTADVLGMYLVVTFAAGYAASRRFQLSQAVSAALYLTANAALLALLVSLPALRRYLFGLVLGSALVLELLARRGARIDSRYLVGAVGAMAAGFVLWALDLTGALCAPPSLWQGHAAWHVLSAASGGMLYLYYDSERRQPTEARPRA